MSTGDKSTHAIKDAILREDFVSFYGRCHDELNPGTAFSSAWFIEHIAYEIREMMGGSTNRLLLALPPRSGKTMMVSVAFSAWCLGHNPALRIIAASYSQDLANKISGFFRAVVESDWYLKLFPGFQIDPDKNSEREIRTTAGGGRFATSVGGPLTGIGGDMLILDDIIKADDAQNETFRALVMNWLQTTAFSRLDDLNTGKIVIIGQRLHVLDPIGQLLEKENWRYVSLPLISEKTAIYRLARFKGYAEKTWKTGELLDPARWNENVIRDLRENMGPAAFNAQYLQRPEYSEDVYIDWNWFPRFEKAPPFDLLVLSVDPAIATKSTSDWSVIKVIGIIGKNYYVVHVDRKRIGFELLKERILYLANHFKADAIFVEAAAIGISLIEALESDGTFIILHAFPKGSKEERMIKVLPIIETGRVLLPKTAPWLDANRQEMQAFPNGMYDDQVDTLSQFLLYHVRICHRAFLVKRHLGHRMPQYSYSPIGVQPYVS